MALYITCDDLFVYVAVLGTNSRRTDLDGEWRDHDFDRLLGKRPPRAIRPHCIGRLLPSVLLRDADSQSNHIARSRRVLQ